MNAETEQRLKRRRDHSSQMLGIYHRARHAVEVQVNEKIKQATEEER